MSKRRIFTPETKVAIVREHLLDGVPISDLCDKHGIHATQYYTWQKQLFEKGADCFARKTKQPTHGGKTMLDKNKLSNSKPRFNSKTRWSRSYWRSTSN